jgi:hypothetical protein
MNSTKTLSIMGNPKSRGSISRTQAPPKSTESESFPRVWRGKVVLMYDSHNKSRKETPSKSLHENLAKMPLKITEKEK